MSLVDNIYDLNTHEELRLDLKTTALKVATGWIYRGYASTLDTVISVYVPYSATPDEFLDDLHTKQRVDAFTNTLSVPNGEIYQTFRGGEIASMVFVPNTF